MSKSLKYFKNIRDQFKSFSTKYDASMLGELGRGAGKGGGGGGPIREAGGPFGKLEAAREEEYFYKLQRRLLLGLKTKLNEENGLRDREIDEHKSAIEENDKLAKEIDHKLNDCDKNK